MRYQIYASHKFLFCRLINLWGLLLLKIIVVVTKRDICNLDKLAMGSWDTLPFQYLCVYVQDTEIPNLQECKVEGGGSNVHLEINEIFHHSGSVLASSLQILVLFTRTATPS